MTLHFEQLGRWFGGLALAFALTFALAPDAAAQKGSAAMEGAGFITGQWSVQGSYAGEAAGGVNFTVTFNSDGTFVDRDNYRGRWLVSGSSFSMHYPDDSHLGYVGTIQGDTISGRFDGLETAGTFQMSRMGGGQRASNTAGPLPTAFLPDVAREVLAGNRERLLSAFVFGDSAQGHDYWYAFYQGAPLTSEASGYLREWIARHEAGERPPEH